MGFLDKVKEQAAVVSEAAKDAAQKGQAKLEDVQAKRAADALLRDLGAAVFAQKVGRGTDADQANIDRLVTELRQFEADHGPISSDSPAPPAPPAPSPTTIPTSTTIPSGTTGDGALPS